jgi:hypothetical protein
MKLFLQPNDIASLTGFNGNIDNDSIKPAINTAQTTQVKRVLGAKLYDKIYTDLNSLSGNYAIIFNDYVVYMTAFFTASIYLSLSVDKVANGGVFKLSAENATNTSDAKVNLLSKNYEAIAISYENNFKEFMSTITIPEWGVEEKQSENTNFINWY